MLRSRIQCAVIGCRRTTRNDGVWLEFICAKHWPMVDRRLRRLLARIKRKAKQGGWTPCLAARERRLWGRAKRLATEVSVGIR